MKTLRKYDREVPAEKSKDLLAVNDDNMTESQINDDTETSADRIRELALSDSLTSAVLIVCELQELKARMSRELDLLEDRRKTQAKDHVKLLAQLWEELHKIRGQFRIEAQLLNLIRPDEEEADNVKHQYRREKIQQRRSN